MNVVIIGSGNVAWHLGEVLKKKGESIIQVYSRTQEHAKLLAEHLHTSYTTEFSAIKTNADLYIFAISDDAIYKVCKNLVLKVQINNSLCVHTAGSVEMTALKTLTDNFGVFYPLQTFSKKQAVDFSEIPICIEANSEKSLISLRKLGQKISKSVSIINSEQRKQIHLSAVFACNFTNHFYVLAEKILAEKNIDFEILKPLLKQTTKKAMLSKSPKNAQTGPAIRQDTLTMNKHTTALSKFPELQEIYKLISKNIFKQ